MVPSPPKGPSSRPADETAAASRPWVAPARARWPGVDHDPATFERFVTDHGHALDSLPAERLGDLWIACACATGDGAALAAFETAFFGDLRPALSRLSLDATRFDEARP